MDILSKLYLINLGQGRTFANGNNPYQIMTRLLEACGELAEQVHIFEDSDVKRQKQGTPDPGQMAKEFQDVIGCVIQIANHYQLWPTIHESIEMRLYKSQIDGRVTIQDLARPELNQLAGWPPRNVLCISTVVLKGDAVLLVRQAEGTSLAGQWSVPWGLVEAGEWTDAAAIRETCEEAGVTVQIKGLLGVQNLDWHNTTALVYLCTPTAGEPTPDGVETDQAGYFTLAALDTLPDPIEPWTDWLVRRVLQGDYTLVPEANGNPLTPQSAHL